MKAPCRLFVECAEFFPQRMSNCDPALRHGVLATSQRQIDNLVLPLVRCNIHGEKQDFVNRLPNPHALRHNKNARHGFAGSHALICGGRIAETSYVSNARECAAAHSQMSASRACMRSQPSGVIPSCSDDINGRPLSDCRGLNPSGTGVVTVFRRSRTDAPRCADRSGRRRWRECHKYLRQSRWWRGPASPCPPE